MYSFLTLPQEVSRLIELVQNKPGFVRLPYHELYSVYFHPVVAAKFKGDQEYIPFPEARYISPLLVKNHLRHAMQYRDADDNASHLVSLIVGSCNVTGTDSMSEATAELTFNIKAKDGSLIVHGSIDHVPAVRLLFWPPQAASWVTRCRLWPPHDIIQSIVDKGCQLVPRSSVGGDIHSEWRLSFSAPEAILAQLRTKEQKQVYYFFKMLFYRYLKGVESSEGKSLYSYIIKTIMLWACEEFLPEDPIWTSLESSVQMLLFKLLGSLEVRYLSHYFIPEINLLEFIGADVMEKCVATISCLRNNILMAAPFDMPEKREFVNTINTYLKQANALRDLLSTSSDVESIIAMLVNLFPKKKT